MKKAFKKVFVPHTRSNPIPIFWHPISVALFTFLTVLLCLIVLFENTDTFEPGTLLGDIQSGVIIAFTNQNRQVQNIPELVENEILTQAATRKAQDMATNQYFAHYSPQGVSPWFWFDQAEYQYDRAGENLAVLFNDSERVVQAWMNSPAHRDNILKEGYTEIGIGTAEGVYKGRNTTYIVQFFAKPKSDIHSKIFTFETQNRGLNYPANVQGIEITTFSFKDLFSKQYILFTSVFIFSLLLFVSACIALLLFFIKHSHNNAILKLYVFCIVVSFASLLYLYIFIFQNSTFI